jgi:hypothetical protein
MTEFNDPGEWNAASYTADPIDAIEPIETVTSDYRKCAILMLQVLRGLDEFNCKGGPSRKWLACSLALGLPSTAGRTESAIAIEWGVTRAAVSKDVVAVLALSGLENHPAWGLKSAHDRETYSRTNGRRRLEHRLGDTIPEPNAGDFPAA